MRASERLIDRASDRCWDALMRAADRWDRATERAHRPETGTAWDAGWPTERVGWRDRWRRLGSARIGGDAMPP